MVNYHTFDLRIHVGPHEASQSPRGLYWSIYKENVCSLLKAYTLSQNNFGHTFYYPNTAWVEHRKARKQDSQACSCSWEHPTRAGGSSRHTFFPDLVISSHHRETRRYHTGVGTCFKRDYLEDYGHHWKRTMCCWKDLHGDLSIDRFFWLRNVSVLEIVPFEKYSHPGAITACFTVLKLNLVSRWCSHRCDLYHLE